MFAIPCELLSIGNDLCRSFVRQSGKGFLMMGANPIARFSLTPAMPEGFSPMKATPYLIFIGDTLIAKRSTLDKATTQADNIRAALGNTPTAQGVSVSVRFGTGEIVHSA